MKSVLNNIAIKPIFTHFRSLKPDLLLIVRRINVTRLNGCRAIGKSLDYCLSNDPINCKCKKLFLTTIIINANTNKYFILLSC